LDGRLESLDKEIMSAVNTLPQANRNLVTGHESMGYFAQRYGFKLVGAIIPSITTQADVSASDLAQLKKLITDNQVKAVFTELGTPKSVADTIGSETGIKVIELATHNLPPDDSYFTFVRNMANSIVDGLK
jgi:zinc/manganese transport system substrate-binding protein